MMTATEMIPAIGAIVEVRFEKCWFECWVKDVKVSWNKPRLLIHPCSGTDEQWVELDRVRLIVSTPRRFSAVARRTA